MSEPGRQGQDPYKQEELRLRKREIRYAGIALVVQFVVAVCALGATLVALEAARSAGDAVEVAAQGLEQQANADRLTTAIASIGGEQAAELVAGFTLLRYHIQDRVRTSGSRAEDLDAYNLYTTSLDILENYLRNPPPPSKDPAAEKRGWGSGVQRSRTTTNTRPVSSGIS